MLTTCLILSGLFIIWLIWRLLPLIMLIPIFRIWRTNPKVAEFSRAWAERGFRNFGYIKRFFLLPERALMYRSGRYQQWNWLKWRIEFCGRDCPLKGKCKWSGRCRDD